jgi:hypothetical protein
MRNLFASALSLLAFALPTASAKAAGAYATCTGAEGITVEVDFLKSKMRYTINGTQTNWSPIFKQGLTPEKLIAMAVGTPEDPAILVMNSTVGTASTFIVAGQRVTLVCN